MPVSDTTPIISYDGNGSTVTPYVIPFKFNDNSHVVMLIDGVVSADGFTLTGAGNDAGGSATTTVAYADTKKVTFRRVVPMSQEYEYNDGDRRPASTVINQHDLRTMQIQQVNEEVGRAIKAGPGETPPGGTFAQAANTVTGQDADGDLIQRTKAQMLDFLDVGTSVAAAAASATAAAASEAAAATSETNAATSATEAETSNVNASNAVLDLAEKSFSSALFSTGTGDSVISGDVVISLPGSPDITIKDSARPYAEDNAINGQGAKLSQLWPDIVNIIQGNYTDYDSEEDFGNGLGPTISNPVPIVAWDVKSYQEPYSDTTLYELVYYGSEESIDLSTILPSPYVTVPTTLTPPSDLPFLSKLATVELSQTHKDNLAAQWPEAAESPFNFKLPVICQRVKDLSNPSYIGTVPNWVTLMTFGDSMGHRVHNNLADIMTRKLSLAGIGFDAVEYDNTSGTVNIPAANTQRRQDLWGPGSCMQLEAGGVLEFGALEGGATVIPFNCTDLSLYLVTESGGGDVEIEYSKDDGATWTSLESGISTDAAQGALVKTYSFTEGTHKFRLTASGGNVEFIGALLRNEKHKGFVNCLSATGGNSLSGFVQGDTDILDAVLADVDPDLVISHYYEDNATVLSSFDTYADQIQDAAPSADHCYFAEHEQDDTGQKEEENNPVYRAKALTVERLQIWETGKVFQSWENAVDLGWTTDPIHYDYAAWRFQASELIQHFGLSGAQNIEIVASYQDGNTDRYEIRGHRPKVNTHIDFISDESYDQYFKFQWDDSDNTSSTAERYWSFLRHGDGDATSPEGFQINRYTSSGSQNVVLWDKLGRGYYGAYNVSTVPPAFEAAVFAHESISGKAALAARHFTATQNAIEVYQGSDTANLNATIKASGIAMFQTLDVSNWVTAADDTAAASAGVAIGNTYKTAGGELRYRVS